MGHEHQAGVSGPALQARDQVSPVGRRLQDFRLDAVFGEEVPGQFADRRLVTGGHEARVHRRNAHQRLFEGYDVVFSFVNLAEKVG